MKIKRIQKSGFTLVEFLLYISLFSVFFVSLFLILQIFYENRANNNLQLELEEQGLIITKIINQEIRNAKSINLPLVNTSLDQLSLSTYDLNDDPVLIYYQAGQIKYSKGGSLNTFLSSSRLIVSDLIFENISTSNVSTITYSFNLIHNDYSKRFYSSVNLNLINL